MIYFCCDDGLRREAVRNHAVLNGIDFLEVKDDPALPDDQRQRTLFVHFVKPLAPGALGRTNLRIDGGERVRDVAVSGNPVAGAEILAVEVDKPGDFSTYTLRLVSDPAHEQPPPGFDPVLARVDFSFKVECPSDFDCKTERVCPPEDLARPEIDYLAKDYASFRRLMLDRMGLLMPQWKERNAADLGVALVELLAYAGDQLSYQQDAVATEAYLGTARKRVSVRRHARLVDYAMHDGCNARAWVALHVAAEADRKVLPGPSRKGDRPGCLLLTKVDAPRGTLPAEPATASGQGAQAFETMHDLILFQAHNEINFYTWGNARCCLPARATRATLCDGPDLARRLRLCKGDVLIFEERKGPNTNDRADADPAHRHAVRLKRVDPEAERVMDATGENEIGRVPAPAVIDPLTGQAIVEIEWKPEDAPAFPVCLSAVTDEEHGQQSVENVSVALGNVVLADHGRSLSQDLGDPVPRADPRWVRVPEQRAGCCGDEAELEEERARLQIPPRYRPRLDEAPVTQVGPYRPSAPATAAIQWDILRALPAIRLTGTVPQATPVSWLPQRDLLLSDSSKDHFVVEVEADGSASLRFGDDHYGRRPLAETKFSATYRVGNGVAGNVGAEAIAHVVGVPGVEDVRNPMPARGGVEPESIEHVRQSAPHAFRELQRAVTEDDYAELAQRCESAVQRAAGTFRWTGSWHTAFVTADLRDGKNADEAFRARLRDDLERYRMAGCDLEVDLPRLVSLEIEMQVCVKLDYFRSHVKAALLDVFSNRVLRDGRRGVFHADNFTFGTAVYLSPLYAAAQAVAGVDSVTITKFQRQGIDSTEAQDAGKLELARLEIARLDNDPNYPEHGVFRVIASGGK